MSTSSSDFFVNKAKWKYFFKLKYCSQSVQVFQRDSLLKLKAIWSHGISSRADLLEIQRANQILSVLKIMARRIEKDLMQKISEDMDIKIELVHDIKLKAQLISLKSQWEKMITLENEFSSAILEVRNKFDEEFAEIYASIDRIQSGVDSIKLEDITGYELYLNPEEEKQVELLLQKNSGKEVSGFWLKVISNSGLSKQMSNDDIVIFGKLGSLLLETENNLDFRVHEIRFVFDVNEYFENMLVVVRVKEDLIYGNFEVIEAEKIVWKLEKDLIVKFMEDLNMKTICVLFFEAEILQEGKIKEELIKAQNEISKIFIQEIIPNSLEWYLGMRTP